LQLGSSVCCISELISENMYYTESLWDFLEGSKENCGNFELGNENIQIFEEIIGTEKVLFCFRRI
jgi:hypothetical protein